MEHKGIVKFNGGRGAILCNTCLVIMKEDLTDHEFQTAYLERNVCDECNEFKEEFCEIMERLGLSNDDVAKRIGVSRPTVARWKEGLNAPHRLVRPLILHELDGEEIEMFELHGAW